MSIRKIIKSLFPFFAILFAGFCLITNNSGVYRIYNSVSLPFVYRLHSSTPNEYIPYIEKAANEWGAVEGAYFEFRRGENTPTGTLGRNNQNLVFFDLLGENFEDNTDVIAFSSTFTSNTSGFHAVESDYIYNARDFNPGLNGESGRQDLASISIHELGHHTGLDHTGLPGGANSGCGPLVPSAVMWAFSAGGDTSHRHLTDEDIMGIISLYPNWVLSGKLTDASNGQPLADSEINLNGTLGTRIGPVINPVSDRISRVGLLLTKLMSDASGNYSTAVKDKNFSISADRFGYYPVNKAISFNTISGFGKTQTITENISLSKTPMVNLSVSVSDPVNNKAVKTTYKLYWSGKSDSVIINDVTGDDGLISRVVSSAEYYKLVLEFDLPYRNNIIYDSILVPETGLNLDIKVSPASVLYVKDSKSSVNEATNENLLKDTNIEYAVWDNVEENTNISIEWTADFSKPLTIFWYAEMSDSSGPGEQDIQFLKNHLKNGGRLILSGINIAEKLKEDSLITDYIGVTQTANQIGFPIIGFANDIVGNGLSLTVTGSKDILALTNSSFSSTDKSFHYGTGAADTAKIAAVRFENSHFGYKGYFMGFGFESISDLNKRNDLFSRIINYLNVQSPTSITNSSLVPLEYSLNQNFPNPFNPKTVISFTIPNDEMVELKIYNSIGQEVKTLINDFTQRGIHRVEFNASNLSSGIYYYRIKAGNFSDTKKFVLLK